MELWIRSQDKEKLVIAEEIKIEREYIAHRYQELFHINTAYDELGTYETKERALKVLDEIDSIIQTNELFDLYSKLGNVPNRFIEEHSVVPVFQMPKK